MSESINQGEWSQARLMLEVRPNDTQAVLAWCMNVGLIKASMECRRHREPRVLQFRVDRDLHTWNCGKCKDRISVTRGSIFEDANLPLGKVLMLALCFARAYTYEESQVSCIFTSNEDRPIRATIAHWFSIFRDRLVDHVADMISGDGLIGGPGVIVQIDEALIGRRKYNRGRVVQGTWVLGMIDSSGKVRLEICARRDATTLRDIIKRHVLPGSVIHTDSWKGYSHLDNLGYTHRTVNHSTEFVAIDGTHTQRIESQWRNIRRTFSRGGIPHDDIGDHLMEYMWRQNCKQTKIDPFASLISILKL